VSVGSRGFQTTKLSGTLTVFLVCEMKNVSLIRFFEFQYKIILLGLAVPMPEKLVSKNSVMKF